MAKNTDELVVAEDDNAAIYVAPVGTPEPADSVAVLNAAWEEVGYVTTDGVTLRLERSVTDIGSWQSRFPTRRLNNANAFQTAFVMQQWDDISLPLAFGGGAVVENTPGEFEFDIPDGGTDDRALLIEFADGDKHYRIVVPKGNVSEPVESQFSRTAEARLPITFQGLKVAGSPIAYFLSDDPAFAEAS